MSSPEADEPFSAFLAAFDEALAAGRATDDTSAPPELQARLHRARSCLERLERDRRQVPRRDVRTIGRFEVRQELGRGGYGIVFLAFDPLLRRDVALKVPRLEAVFDAEQRRRFLREAQSAAGLEHPNVVPVFEAGQAGGVSYIASAYCSGPTLAAWLHGQRNLVAPHTAAALVAALADGVHSAHQHGILHRDLKPSNVLLQPAPDVPDGLEFVPRLSDFGLAKLLEHEEESTRSGALLGTPAYMAPEQAEGRSDSVGPATDVYGLGAILYELLTERPPFKGATVLETLEQVRSEMPMPPSRLRPNLPRALETICLKCLEKDSARRYTSGQELAADLRRFLRGESIQARPARWWTRLRQWCRKPERVRDAGGLMFFVGLIHVAWCLAGLTLLYLISLPLDNRQRVVEFCLTMLGFFHIPMTCIGWCVMHRRQIIALWTGALYALAYLSLGLYDALIRNLDMGYFSQNAADRLVFVTFFILVSLILFGAQVVGLWAYYTNRARFRAVAQVPGKRPAVPTIGLQGEETESREGCDESSRSR